MPIDNPISQITSQPTNHELVKKKNRLTRRKDLVDRMLNAKLEAGASIDPEDLAISPDEEDSSTELVCGQKTPDLKNFGDLSCSLDCACDRCLHVKFAMETISTECEQPISHSTPDESMTIKCDFIPSQELNMKDVAKSYLHSLKEKIDHLNNIVDSVEDEEFILKVVDAAEKSAIHLDSLM